MPEWAVTKTLMRMCHQAPCTFRFLDWESGADARGQSCSCLCVVSRRKSVIPSQTCVLNILEGVGDLQLTKRPFTCDNLCMDNQCQLSVLPCTHKLRPSGVLPFACPTPFQSFYCLDNLPGKGGSPWATSTLWVMVADGRICWFVVGCRYSMFFGSWWKVFSIITYIRSPVGSSHGHALRHVPHGVHCSRTTFLLNIDNF